MTEYIVADYVLDPFVSIGEIAIIMPGTQIWFAPDYFHAELAARNWITARELGLIGDGRIDIEDEPPIDWPIPGDPPPGLN